MGALMRGFFVILLLVLGILTGSALANDDIIWYSSIEISPNQHINLLQDYSLFVGELSALEDGAIVSLYDGDELITSDAVYPGHPLIYKRDGKIILKVEGSKYRKLTITQYLDEMKDDVSYLYTGSFALGEGEAQKLRGDMEIRFVEIRNGDVELELHVGGYRVYAEEVPVGGFFGYAEENEEGDELDGVVFGVVEDVTEENDKKIALISIKQLREPTVRICENCTLSVEVDSERNIVYITSPSSEMFKTLKVYLDDVLIDSREMAQASVSVYTAYLPELSPGRHTLRVVVQIDNSVCSKEVSFFAGMSPQKPKEQEMTSQPEEQSQIPPSPAAPPTLPFVSVVVVVLSLCIFMFLRRFGK